jgi:molecular chaperone GrpE (heat shock protein)
MKKLLLALICTLFLLVASVKSVNAEEVEEFPTSSVPTEEVIENEEEIPTSPTEDEVIENEEIIETFPDVEETPEENVQPSDDWKDKYVRLYAEFDNYKKRSQKEMLSSYTNGLSSAIEQMLPIVDNFDRAIAAIDDNAKNELVFNNGLKEEVIALNSGAILNKAYYESASNSLVLYFKLENGESEEIKIPVSDFAVKINVLNSGRNVTLISSYDNNTNTHNLSADVNISSIENNILKSDGNSIYVLGVSENIKHNNTTVQNELISLNNKYDSLNTKVDSNYSELSNKNSEIEKIANDNKNSIQEECDRAKSKEDNLLELITQETNRAKDAEFANSNSITQLTGRIDNVDEKYQIKGDELSQEILDLKEYIDNKADNITYHVESTNTIDLASFSSPLICSTNSFFNSRLALKILSSINYFENKTPYALKKIA